MRSDNGTERPINDDRIGRLSERLKLAIGDTSFRALAEKAGVSEGTVRNLMGGGIPRLDIILRIADAVGVSAPWLATGMGAMHQEDHVYTQEKEATTTPQAQPESFLSEFALIPGYNVQVSAGWGSEGSDEAEPSRHLAFRKRWLKWRGFSEKDLVIVWAKGDSMEPVISNNNTLVINTAQKQLTDGNIFVLRNDNQLWVKRVQVRPGSWVLLSDNSNYPPFEVPMDEQNNFEVVGQVVHISKDVGN